MLRRYRKHAAHFVTAVRLDLDTDGFTYRKWGATQKCKRGDWLVNSDGETYTVDAESFARTYTQQGPGVYIKSAVVYAEARATAGAIRTKEGVSHYEAGDYVVYNEPGAVDGYTVARDVFEREYQPVDD